MLTHGIPPDFRAASIIYLNRHTPLGQSRVYRVTQLRTNGVHCRKSAGTGPVVLKVVPVTGAAILQVNMDQLMCASLFPHGLDTRKVKVEMPSCFLCIYGHTYSKSIDQPGKVASPARGRLNRKNECFPVRVRASSPQGSSSNKCCHFAGHHGPINVRLSFPTRCRYSEG